MHASFPEAGPGHSFVLSVPPRTRHEATDVRRLRVTHGLTLNDLRGDPRRVRTERIVKWVLTAAATVSVLISAGIIWSLAKEAWTFVTEVEWGTVLFSDGLVPPSGRLRHPHAPRRNALGHGHRDGGGGARRVGERHLPVGVPRPRVRRIVKPTLEVLAGIPSVVLGFFAVSVISPSIVQRFTDSGLFSLASAGIAVGSCRSARRIGVRGCAPLRAVALREASYGMGAKKITTVTKVVVPAAVSGLVAAFILAVSRAIGETMVVFIAAGAAGTQPFEVSPLEPGLTMTAAMATHGARHRPGEGGGLTFQSLYFVGAVLFLITLLPQRGGRPVRPQGPAGLLMASTIGIGAESAARSVREQLTGRRAGITPGGCFPVLLWLSLGFSLGVLAVLFYDVLIEGVGVFTTRGRVVPLRRASLERRPSGIFQAIKGTFWIGVFVVVLSFPIGVASAVYLEEYATKGGFARLVDVNIRNLAGVPSIVYGILGLTLFVQSMEAFTGGATLHGRGHHPRRSWCCRS